MAASTGHYFQWVTMAMSCLYRLYYRFVGEVVSRQKSLRASHPKEIITAVSALLKDLLILLLQVLILLLSLVWQIEPLLCLSHKTSCSDCLRF